MEEQEEYKKVTLIDQLAIAVSSPKNYKHLTKLKTSRLVWFVVILSFLLAFIEFGIDAIFWTAKVGGFRNLAENVIPAFSYEDGKMSIERDIQVAVGNGNLYINTENAEVDLNEMTTDGAYVAIGSENVTVGVVSGGKGYEYMVTPIKYFMLPNGFNNASLAACAPLFYVYMFVMFMFVMIGCAGRQLLLALLFSIVGNSFAKHLNTRLTYGKVFTICVYAQTLAMLLLSVNTAVDYMISSFILWMAAMMISMVFMNRAIMAHVSGDIPPGDIF